MIREACIEDVPQLVAMGERSIARYYADTVSANREQMAETASMAIELPSGGVWVSETDGRLVAMIGLLLMPDHLSGLLTACEIFWFSDDGRSGMRLLRTAIAWAKAQGAVALRMIQPMTAAKLAVVYGHFGFRPLEVAWQLDL